MTEWNLNDSGELHLEEVKKIMVGFAKDKNGRPSVVFSIFTNDISAGSAKSIRFQFIIPPNRAGKFAEMLAISAKNALS